MAQRHALTIGSILASVAVAALSAAACSTAPSANAELEQLTVQPNGGATLGTPFPGSDASTPSADSSGGQVEGQAASDTLSPSDLQDAGPSDGDTVEATETEGGDTLDLQDADAVSEAADGVEADISAPETEAPDGASGEVQESDSLASDADEGDVAEADSESEEADSEEADAEAPDADAETPDADAEAPDADAEAPEDPICTPGETGCQGQDAVVCDTSGEAWTLVETCPETTPCVEGACCAPQCEGKSCGGDGCGGSCGSCDAGVLCTEAGQCEAPPVCEEGESCDDQDACTEGDTCVEGACVGTPLLCDDGDPCTEDTCGTDGCSATPLVCDDGDPCTHDLCEAGSCTTTPLTCDDDDLCTEDSCGPEGCVFEPKECEDGLACTKHECVAGACEQSVQEGSCLIEGKCLWSGAMSSDTPCMGCAPELSVTAWSPMEGASCDDEDACTEGDACTLSAEGIAACVGISIVSETEDPCTEEVCVDGSLLSKPVNGAPCVPDDLCSATGTCTDAACIPDAPCECYEDDDCDASEICVDQTCTGTYCGNGICDPGDDTGCPDDCVNCPSAAWCPGFCPDPIFGALACSLDCCGDGFCALSESETCCPEDCAPQNACEDIQVVTGIPASITGNHNQSNAVLSTSVSQCGGDALIELFDYGEGREDVIAFVAPFKGNFFFQLEGPWNSQFWFFSDCADPAGSCVETGPDILGDGSTIITVPLDEGETIYTVVDAVSIYFGAGSYTLIIDGLCAPDCEDKACGDDGCGGSCGTCPGAQICGDSGACLKPAEVCDYHLDCPAHEVCGYWPTDGLNRCSELCLGPKDCDAGELCAKMPGGAHLAYCQDQGPGDAVGSPCTSSETCASGLCVTGACREACVAQSGCEGGMVCRALQTASGLTSVCVPPSGTEAGTSCGNCSSDHCDMLAGADDPLCANLCANQSDCEAGQACYLIDFYPATNPATVPYHPTYDEAMNDALMGCYTVDGSQTGAPDGSPCAANEECLSGTCLPIASDGASYCTRACVATTDCGGGMTCRLTGVNMVSLFLLELDLWEPANYTLVRFCDFPFGAP